ncbi:MAG: hypothetical protein WAM28_06290 [Chlamydiales bacterium]
MAAPISRTETCNQTETQSLVLEKDADASSLEGKTNEAALKAMPDVQQAKVLDAKVQKERDATCEGMFWPTSGERIREKMRERDRALEALLQKNLKRCIMLEELDFQRELDDTLKDLRVKAEREKEAENSLPREQRK